MKLKKPIDLSTTLFNDINFVKDKMMIIRNAMFRITDVVMEDVTTVKTKGIFKSRKVPVTKTQLIEISIWGWHPTKKFWGTLDEDAIQRFLWFNDLEQGRHNYVAFKEALEDVGWEITKKKVEPAQNEKDK